MRVPGWLLALVDQGLASAATFAVSLAVGRTAGADELAVYSNAFAVVLFAGSLHQALVAQPLVLLGAGAPAEARGAQLARLAYWHRLGAWWAVPLAGLAACWPGHGLLAATAVLCAAARAGIELRRRSAYLDALPQRALLATICAQGPALAFAGALLLAWWMGTGATLPAVAALLALFAGAAIGCLALAPPGRGHAPAERGPVLRGHWRLGRWYLVSLLVLWATNYAFGWYLTLRGDLREAGYLQAARTLFGLPLAGLLALDAWFQPRAREAWVAEGRRGLQRVAVQQGALAALIAVPCAALLWFRPESIATAVFGPAFAPAAPALALTAWCTLLAIPDRLLGLVIAARHAPEATAAGFAASLALTCWLLPAWSAEGAAGCARLLVVNAAAMVVVPGLWLALRWRRLA